MPVALLCDRGQAKMKKAGIWSSETLPALKSILEIVICILLRLHTNQHQFLHQSLHNLLHLYLARRLQKL